MDPSAIELIATVLLAVAVLHTFMVKRFETLAGRFPPGSIAENTFHLLGEVEVVFGLWATVLLVLFGLHAGSDAAFGYLEGRYVPPGAAGPVTLGFGEPLFVFVVMAMAATRPVLDLTRGLIAAVARGLPLQRDLAFFATCLVLGPLLGSFITEPAAMTVTALLLKQRFYDRGMSPALMYATLGLLFVNVSIGGTLTPFAAPPVVIVASKWDLDFAYMLGHFGWKAVVAVVTATALVAFAFRRELRALPAAASSSGPERPRSPIWLIAVHVALIAAVVATSHHLAAFFGIFLFFLGVADVTREHQDELELRKALLVAYFLLGLVVLGGLQAWWLGPTLAGMSDSALYFGATGLTAVTDNAALTFLGSQVEGLSEASRYALLAGAVTGGGLTVIANAPNPAGYSILTDSFGPTGISPGRLFVAALGPTAIAAVAFLLLPSF